MSSYLVRIVLHDGNWDDYEGLHQHMERVGFSRQILADSGVWYHLPQAEYLVQGDFSFEAVIQAAAQAAELTGKRHSVFVSDVKSFRWQGLTPVAQTIPAAR